MPETNKPWFKSRGVIGGLVAFVAGILALLFGVDIDQATQEQIVGAVFTLVSAFAGIYASYGRVKAKDKIGKR